MSLFVKQDFIGHSGGLLHWKIECHAEHGGLTDDDWCCLAFMAWEHIEVNHPFGYGGFSQLEGIPRGGVKLATRMKEIWPTHLIDPRGPCIFVDDVLTTGKSFRDVMSENNCGLVVFARGPLPPRVTALFAMPAAVEAAYNQGFDAAASAGSV